MSSTTRQQVFKEIVLMRKPVRAAHVRTIHKLTRSSKSLVSKKGTDEQLVKNKRKAEKFSEEIIAAKKIKDDEITKFALMNEKETAAILQDPNSDAKTRVIAKIASCEILKKKVEEIKQKFPLYKECLTTPGKRELQKLKKKEMKEKSDEKVEPAKTETEKKNEESVENSDCEEEMAESGEEKEMENNSDSQSEEIDESDEEEKMEIPDVEEELIEEQKPKKLTNEKKKEKKCMKKEEMSNENLESNEEEIENLEEEMQQVEIVKSKKEEKKSGEQCKKKAKKQKKVSPKVESPKKDVIAKPIIKLAKVQKLFELVEDPEETEIVVEQETSVQTGLTVQTDDFLTTTDGTKCYNSLLAPKQYSEDRSKKGFSEFENRASRRSQQYENPRYRDSNKNANRNFFKKNNYEQSSERLDFHGSYNKSYPNETKNYDQGFQDQPKIEKKVAKKEENLHPSWEAKKKQQDLIKQGPQGKKIIFDD